MCHHLPLLQPAEGVNWAVQVIPENVEDSDSMTVLSDIYVDSCSILVRIGQPLYRKDVDVYHGITHSILKLAHFFKCTSSSCSFTTNVASAYTKHLSMDHCHDTWPFSCTYCQYSSMNSESLVQHMMEHHESWIFQCIQCFFRSFSVKSMNNHLVSSPFHTSGIVILFDCQLKFIT